MDATTLMKGKVQLSGDLSGTAIVPRVAENAITSVKILDGTVATVDLADGSITNAKISLGISAAKVGLENVNNTSDASKPISLATQAALDLKTSAVSPSFSGIPLAPTASPGTNTTQIATTAFVLANINGYGFGYSSIDASVPISTTSPTDVQVTGMTLTPGAGTYMVHFNSAYTVAPINITGQAKSELIIAYNRLMAVTATKTDHAASFGSETLPAGVYTIAAAGSVNGVLTLNGQGDPDALFIFRFGGAFSTGASTSVVLTGSASAGNVFWLAEGAMSLGANTQMNGTMISNMGASSAGVNCNLVGRLLTSNGAVAISSLNISLPTASTFINLGSLSSFAIFTSLGNMTNVGPSIISGDVGSNDGIATGFESASMNGKILLAGSTSGSGVYSIYQNGVLISNSSRTRTNSINTVDITLQAVATVLDGQPIDVRWRTDAGMLGFGNRILSLTKVR